MELNYFRVVSDTVQGTINKWIEEVICFQVNEM